MAVSVCSININPIALATPSFSFKSLKFPSFWPTQKVKMGPLSVSPMRFGTWAWGTTASISLIFDTADSYGTGKLNEQKGSQRERVIATKFAAYPWRLTPGQFVNACRASLDRMQIEQIGMGQLHRSTTNYAPLQELALWDGLDLVKAVGVSNYGPKQLLKAPWSPLVLSPGKVQFSLLSTGKYQLKIKSICDSLGIRMIAYSPLGLGMLTGKYSSSKLPSGPRALLFKQILPGLDPLLSSLREIANKRRKTMSQVIFFLCCYKLVHRFQLLESNQLNKLRKIWVLFVGASPQTSCFSWRMQQMNHLAG
ncbi:Pyridoxal reductase, chloroplastic [Glycine max]|nr:Pyridoxal reductase, chloroplastic [Glycine max]KAH1255622.1 Pyridoxal reductase, chloroplastic [Glycine max]